MSYVVINPASGSPSYAGGIRSRHRTAEAAVRRAENINRATRRRSPTAYSVAEAYAVTRDDLDSDGQRLRQGCGQHLG